MTSNRASTHPAYGWRRLGTTLWPYLWPKDAPTLRARVILAVTILITAKLINILVPFFLKAIVDGLDTTGVLVIPFAAIFAYGAARLTSALFANLRDAVFARVGYRAGRQLALRTYKHLFDLSLRYHLDRRTGELSRAIERGVKALSFMLRIALFNLVPTLFEFSLVIAILLVRYNWSFAAITFFTIVGYACFTVFTTEWRMRFRRQMNDADNLVGAQSVDGLINYETVKSFTNEGYEARRLDQALSRYEDAAERTEFSLSALNAGQAAIIAIGVTLIMIEAARRVVSGELTVGDVVLVNAFILQLYQPLNFLGVAYREIKQAVIDLENIDGLLDLLPEIQDRPNAITYQPSSARITFEKVSFAYDARRAILEDVSFTVPAGRKLAVVGSSGAGKSTIVRLLFRFYETERGQVLVDDFDIRDITQESLRQAIGVVPQDTVLFNDTIEANIAYGRPGATRNDVIEAARTAQIHQFIDDLPDGYATLVGERGLKLSGGEKQRVAIARVMLKDPAILVLDEATSALDTRTEQALQEALKRVAQGRTTLVIAHRLSTVVDADEILVLESGRVVERGSFETLIQANGHFAEMWRRQQQAPSAQDASRQPVT